jgi:hypothetical protein
MQRIARATDQGAVAHATPPIGLVPGDLPEKLVQISSRASPKSAPPSVMSSVIAARKSANGRKRTQVPATHGRRQIAPGQRLAPETGVFIGVAEIAFADSHSLRIPFVCDFAEHFRRFFKNTILSPTVVQPDELLSN